MIQYAREDTHYLLHIADLIRNDLVSYSTGGTSLVSVVFDVCSLIDFSFVLFH